MAKREKTKRFSIQTYDTAHYRQTEQYAKVIETLFDKATDDITKAVAKGAYNPDKVFSFDDYPSVKSVMQKVTMQLASKMSAVITSGSKKQWLFACDKNDGFLNSIMDTSKVKKSQLKKMQDRNLDALSAFQKRKVDGMNLSQRIWKYTKQYQEQLEQALDVGLGEGRSAQQLSRDVRQNLKEPNRLFRRVRDKRGNLVLSKNAAAFHPGQGVYRSSYKNAMRLTRSEINMAYRESDYRRWNGLDFVVGFEIKRSNHKPLCKCKICEKLTGRYPKTFKFKGWHPQCMCYAVPILMDEEMFDANELGDLKAAFKGTQYKKLEAKNVVTDVPDGFKEWVKDNMDAQKDWKSTPYFIRDNFKDGKLSEGLKIAMPTVAMSGKVDYNKPFEQLAKQEQASWTSFINDVYPVDFDLEHACRLYGIDITTLAKDLQQAHDGNEYWREAELRASIQEKETEVQNTIARYKAQAENIIKEMTSLVKEADGWIDDLSDLYDFVVNDFNAEEGEKYPNYKQFANSKQSGTLDATKTRQKIEKAKTDYNQAIVKAKECINQYDGKVDIANLKSLMNEIRTTDRPAVDITKDITAEITKVENEWSVFQGKVQNGELAEVIETLNSTTIESRPIAKMEKEMTKEAIIAKIGGGDRTEGSCASVGLAYAANRGGLDVLDFRDGKSRDFFSTTNNLRDIVRKCGGIVEEHLASGIEMMRKTEIGKEYYLVIGRHAAIVRQVSKGKYEYLELQSSWNNGWHHLDAKVFGWRFVAKGRCYRPSLIDIDLLTADKGFQRMMTYINTAEAEQVKGKNGTIK